MEHKIDPHKSCYQISTPDHSSYGLGSAVSSFSGVWGGAPAAKILVHFGLKWKHLAQNFWVVYVPASRVNDAGLVDFQEVLPFCSQ